MLSLLPSDGRTTAPVSTSPGAVLDIVHDHVLRAVGDRDVAHRMVLDVLLRATDRASETREPLTLPVLLRLARARLARCLPEHLDADVLVALAPSADPAARAVAAALATPTERAASLLDLTARHGMDQRTAAAALGLDVRRAATLRAEALQQVHAALAAVGGERVDVEATLAALPVSPAPATLHERLAVARATRLPAALAWLAPVAATAAVAIAIVGGLPSALAGADGADVPLLTAEAVSDEAVVQQLRADGEGLPTTGDDVVVLPSRPTTTDGADVGGATPPAPTSTATPAPAPEATPAPQPDPEDEPTDEPAPEPEPDPEPEPTEGPLDELLPTSP